VNIHGAHSYWKQGTLGPAGVRHAGPQRALYVEGRRHIVAASHTAYFYYVGQNVSFSKKLRKKNSKNAQQKND